MTYGPSPTDDKEFHDWYTSFGQRLSRGIANLFGFEFSFKIAANILLLITSFGWLHSTPVVFVGFSWPKRPGRTFTFFLFGWSCSGTQLTIMEHDFVLKRNECPLCNLEAIKAQEARQRAAQAVIQRIQQQKRNFEEGDGGVGVPAQPIPAHDPSGKGALLQYP